jgi:hypothetical protein
MVIYVDIDDTIADYHIDDSKTDYYKARPIRINIEKINKLYDEGNYITYYTARGSLNTNRRHEYTELTKRQLKEWGAKYHELSVGEKPAYDLLICDKSKRIEEL